MPYTPLTEKQIIANMVKDYAALVPTADDLNRGSNIRSILETFARALREFYVNETEFAAEVQRTAAYTQFKFALLPSLAAYTMEQFTVPVGPIGDATVAAGTTLSVPGTTITYQVASDFTWPAGTTTQNIRIVCTQSGAIGNTPANTITQLNGSIPGLQNVTVTNIKDVKTGRDTETEDQRAQRFTDFLNTLHRGDVAALKYGAKTAQIIDPYGYVTEQVVKAQVVEGSGSNTIYIDNGEYTTSTQLVTQCQTIINGYVDTDGTFVIGYKAAGIPSTVKAATIQLVSIAVAVTPQTGYTLDMIQQTIIDSINNLVAGLDVGDTLYLTDINTAVGNVQGVETYAVSAPIADVVPADGTLLAMAAGSPQITQK